jgi:hypothetical protein
MDKMDKYIVVQSRKIEELANIVNNNIDNGYIPVGSIVISQDYPVDIVQGYVRLRVERGIMFFQSMVIKDNK